MYFFKTIFIPKWKKGNECNAERVTLPFLGERRRPSRESDRNLMAPVCADSFLTARGSTAMEVIGPMVGGSKYRCSWAFSVFINHEFVFHLNTSFSPHLMPPLTRTSIHDTLFHVFDHIQLYGFLF